MLKSPLLMTASLVLAIASQSACGDVFVSTGHTGAQVQVDVSHTQYWTYSLTAPVSGIDGGLFDMKDGSNTVDDITFSIFEGTFADYGIATPLLSVTLTPASFTQSYAPVSFSGTPISLAANTVYTAVLASSAPDPQSKAYFIKQDSLRFVDPAGDPSDPGGAIVDPVPEPASLALLGVGTAAMMVRRRR